MLRKILLIFCSMALLSMGFAAAQEDTSEALDVLEYTLDNGLEVLLVEDHSAPTVAINVWYHVGGANDPEGRSGFAHLFEHMMFEETAHIETGEIDRLITSAGGSLNANRKPPRRKNDANCGLRAGARKVRAQLAEPCPSSLGMTSQPAAAPSRI